MKDPDVTVREDLLTGSTPAGERKVHSLVDDLAGSFLDPSCDTFVKAAYGKTVRAVERRTEASPKGRLLRPDSEEAG